MLKITVTKPRAGKVDIVVADRRGPTGFKQVRRGVSLGDVASEVSTILGAYEAVRDAIEAARRQPLS